MFETSLAFWLICFFNYFFFNNWSFFQGSSFIWGIAFSKNLPSWRPDIPKAHSIWILWNFSKEKPQSSLEIHVFKDLNVLGLQVLMYCCWRKPMGKLLMMYQIKNPNSNCLKWNRVKIRSLAVQKTHNNCV